MSALAVKRIAAPGPPRLDARASQATFRVLLSSLARPGRVERLPVPGVGAAIVPLALAGVDSAFAVVGDDGWREHVLAATGAAVVPLAEAPVVGLCGGVEVGTLRSLARGSALAPEQGAKVGIDCSRLAPPDGTGGVRLELRGPGVAGVATLCVEGLPAGLFAELAEVNAGYPAGIDVWLVDGDGRVAGIPRSATVEVR